MTPTDPEAKEELKPCHDAQIHFHNCDFCSGPGREQAFYLEQELSRKTQECEELKKYHQGLIRENQFIREEFSNKLFGERQRAGKLLGALKSAKPHIDFICKRLEEDGWLGPTEVDITQNKIKEAIAECKRGENK